MSILSNFTTEESKNVARQRNVGGYDMSTQQLQIYSRRRQRLFQHPFQHLHLDLHLKSEFHPPQDQDLDSRLYLL